MAEGKDSANPAAASAGNVTMDQVNQAITAAIRPVTEAVSPLAQTLKDLAANQKVMADTMAADKAKAETGAADKAKPLTKEDVTLLVGEAIQGAFTQQAAAQQSSAQREAFIQQKLAGVPPVYANQLGTDPAKWAEQEAQIREQFKADAAKLGLKVSDVSGGNPGGASTASATDDQKITQLKAAGLSDGEANFAATLQMPGKATS